MDATAHSDKSNVMLVDANPATAYASSAALEKAGFEVTVVASGSAALELIKQVSIACVILDLSVPPGRSGTPVGCSLLKALLSDVGSPAVVAVAEQASLVAAVEAVRCGAFDYLARPFSSNRLVAAVKAALSTPQRHGAPTASPTQAKAAIDENRFIGNCDAMRAVFATLTAAARSQASVFICGESGTGKELAAEAVHKGSTRATRPFVAINCGAVPRDLLESMLFGHARGAFTGATESVQGAAESADGGTLFLDEIGEMDISLQVKLLRFIQSGTYQRVGDPRPRQADIRFVAATNRDPAAAIAEGRLREDLFYRLCVVRVTMPPLRERGSDVMLIARRFLEHYARLEGREFRSIAPEVEDAFNRDRWPGNVRELQNVIHEAVVLHNRSVLTINLLSSERFPQTNARLPESLQLHGFGMPQFAAAAAARPPQEQALIGRLSDAEQNYIEWAIRCCNGNLQAASRKLGISPSTIYRKREMWARQAAGDTYVDA
jgi:DNA-binding NtrC family response regulator